MRAAIIVGFVIGITITNWLTDRVIPITDFHTEAINPVVMKGKSVYMETYLNRKRICNFVTERTLYDSKNQTLELNTKISIRPGPLGKDHNVHEIPIPNIDTVSPGPAMIENRVSWFCNPIHYIWPIQYTYRIKFYIVQADNESVLSLS